MENIVNLLPSFLDLFKVEENEIKLNYIQIFSEVLIFIESYSKEIYSILNIFQYLQNIKKDNYIEKIRTMISKKTIENSEQKINTICFYYVIESILTLIISYLKDKEFFEIS